MKHLGKVKSNWDSDLILKSDYFYYNSVISCIGIKFNQKKNSNVLINGLMCNLIYELFHYNDICRYFFVLCIYSMHIQEFHQKFRMSMKINKRELER